MSIRFSDAAAIMQANDQGLRLGGSNFYFDFFTTSQPTDANNPEQGQKIISFRKSGTGTDVFVANKPATWQLTLSGTTSGSLNHVYVGLFDILGGAVSYSTSFTQTAANAAAQINAYIGNAGFTASSNGAVLTIISPNGVGTNMNAMVLTASATTLTATVAGDGTPVGSGGTAGVAAAYACNWLPPVDGLTLPTPIDVMQLQQELATWSGTAGYDASNTAISGFLNGSAPLTAGWARLKTSLLDTGGATSGANGFFRIDWSVGSTSAFDLQISPTPQFAWGVVNYLTSLALNIPKA